MLSDGRLLAEGEAIGGKRWQLLPPGGTQWCVSPLDAEADARFEIIGDRLAWLLLARSGNPAVLKSLPLSDLHCS